MCRFLDRINMIYRIGHPVGGGRGLDQGRRDVRSVGWENWLRDDGGRVESGILNERRFKL